MPKIPVKPAPMNAESPTGRILVEGNPSRDDAWSRQRFAGALLGVDVGRTLGFYSVADHAAFLSRIDFTEIERRFIAFHDALDAPWCPFCKRHHVGGDTCLGHHP